MKREEIPACRILRHAAWYLIIKSERVPLLPDEWRKEYGEATNLLYDKEAEIVREYAA